MRLAKLYVHRIDPHHAATFADLRAEGYQFCVTESATSPQIETDIVAKFRGLAGANAFIASGKPDARGRVKR